MPKPKYELTINPIIMIVNILNINILLVACSIIYDWWNWLKLYLQVFMLFDDPGRLYDGRVLHVRVKYTVYLQYNALSI